MVGERGSSPEGPAGHTAMRRVRATAGSDGLEPDPPKGRMPLSRTGTEILLVAVQSTGHQEPMSHCCGMMKGMRRVGEIVNIGTSMTRLLRLLVPRRSDFRRHDRETVSDSLEAIDSGVDADMPLTRWPAGADRAAEASSANCARSLLGAVPWGSSHGFCLLQPQAMRCGP